MGNYIPADDAWRFSQLPQYSIVLWQINRSPIVLASEDRRHPIIVQLDGRDDIFVGVNDMWSDYVNNEGKVVIAIREIA